MKIYTRTGDQGETGLIGGDRIKKSDQRIIAYGTIDELNSNLGLSVSLLRTYKEELFLDLIKMLLNIQNELFIIGSDLANPDYSGPDDITTEKKSRFDFRIKNTNVTNLENTIDLLEKELPPITYFILPGGSMEAAQIHISRSVTRRAETCVVKLAENGKINPIVITYLNRLSDLLFVISRTINKRLEIMDVAWKT